MTNIYAFSSIIINYLEQTFKGNAAVAYIYCNYKEQNQTAINLVASLLQQLVQGQSVISNDIIAIYRRHSRKQTRPSFAEYSELLESEAHRFSKVFIVIDALDEVFRKGVFFPKSKSYRQIFIYWLPHDTLQKRSQLIHNLPIDVTS